MKDTEAVARVGYTTLFEAFETAFHGKSVPQGGAAARMLCVAHRGVQPSSQAEWLAPWRLALMQAGPTERAAADRLLAMAGPVTLPWRTIWAQLEDPSGVDPEPAGSSLGQFVAMVRLYYWWFASDWSSRTPSRTYVTG
ncbi:hypothetical protein [Streptomyces sp. NPDC003514]